MYPVICTLFGVVPLPTYGTCIALGVLVALFLALRDKRLRAIITADDIYALLAVGIASGIIGGRLLFLATTDESVQTWYDVIAVWDGGLAVLGTIGAVAIASVFYLWWRSLPILRVFDLLAGLYGGPLVQAFGRIGCFCAGCCYGKAASVAWAVTYTHPLSMAPLCTALHPVQLYNAVALFSLFFILYLMPLPRIAGVLFFSSLTGMGIIRFVTDFWRGDRGELLVSGLSIHQLLSLGMIAVAIGSMVVLTYLHRRRG